MRQGCFGLVYEDGCSADGLRDTHGERKETRYTFGLLELDPRLALDVREERNEAASGNELSSVTLTSRILASQTDPLGADVLRWGWRYDVVVVPVRPVENGVDVRAPGTPPTCGLKLAR